MPILKPHKACHYQREHTMNMRITALLCLVAVALAGCGMPAGLRPSDGLRATAPQTAYIKHVPFVVENDNFCGPAALAMVMGWAGVPVNPQLTGQVFAAGHKGALQGNMLTAAHRNGFWTYPITTMDRLLREVAAGNPVIVLKNLGLTWWPTWQYAVVVGYNLREGTLQQHSCTDQLQTQELTPFASTWQRSGPWGFVALPQSILPVTATAHDAVQAIAGMERAAGPQKAEQGARTALDRWPRNLDLQLMMANLADRTGDHVAALKYLRVATVEHPDNPMGWNNLASVLNALEPATVQTMQSALIAAQTAVAKGSKSPYLHVYLQTLQVVQSHLHRAFPQQPVPQATGTVSP